LKKTPATVITGFLGAGKTSLVRHLAETANGRRLAFIINEFGDLGVDREIVNGCAIPGCDDQDIVELANGCLCCTVADEFVPTLLALLNRPNPPDHIIIETSGLALPKPLVKAFQWPEIRSRVTVDGVLAVVDGPSLLSGAFVEPEAGSPHENPLEEVFTDQLLCADVVIANKSDLLSPHQRMALQADLAARVRPGVRVVLSEHSRLSGAVALGVGAAAEDDLASRPSHHDGDDHDHDDFESFALTLPEMADPAILDGRIAAVVTAHAVLRIKGFVAVAGKPLRQVVQAVGPRVERYFDRPWAATEARTSRLVVIGLKGLDRSAIAATLGAH